MQLTQTNNRGFAPSTITEAIQFSEMLAKSQMVPRQYQNKPEDIMVAVQWGYEIGLAPLQALQNISVINGKPSVYGDAALALVQASSVCEGVEEYFENEETSAMVAVCVCKRAGRKPVTVRFSVEDAKRAGLWNKQGPWQQYPKRMLQMRARGFALRDAFPDVLKGLITAEEAQDFPTQAKDITPAAQVITVSNNPLDAIAPPPPTIAITASDPIEVEDDGHRHYVEVEQPAEMVDIEVETAAEQQIGDAHGYPLFVPGKDEPVSHAATLEQWSVDYDAMADKVAKAGRSDPRTRMTKLRELKESNEALMKMLDPVERVKHTAAYSKRLAGLGAAMNESK